MGLGSLFGIIKKATIDSPGPKIIETTDGQNIGMKIDQSVLQVGCEIELLNGFIFEIKDIKETADMIIASNANYVIILKKAEVQ